MAFHNCYSSSGYQILNHASNRADHAGGRPHLLEYLRSNPRAFQREDFDCVSFFVCEVDPEMGLLAPWLQDRSEVGLT